MTNKKTRKKMASVVSVLLGIAIMLAMVFALLPATTLTAHAESADHYALQNLLRGSGTHVLEKDYYVSTGIGDPNGNFDIKAGDNITLDLNGHKIYSTRDDCFYLKVYGSLTVIDSVGGGQFRFSQIDVDGGTLNIDVRTFSMFGNIKRLIQFGTIALGINAKLNISEYAIGSIERITDYYIGLEDFSAASATVKIEGNMKISDYFHYKGSTVLMSGGKIGALGVRDLSATGKGSDFSIKTTSQQATLGDVDLPKAQTFNLSNYQPKSISQGTAWYGSLNVPSTTPASINSGIRIGEVLNNDVTADDFDPTKGVSIELKPEASYDVWNAFPNNISVSWYRSLNGGSFEKIVTTSEYYYKDTVPFGSNYATYYAVFASEKAGAVRYFESDRVSQNITPAAPADLAVAYSGQTGNISVSIGQNPKLEAKYSTKNNKNGNDVRAEYQWQQLVGNEWQNINYATKATYYPGSAEITEKTLRVGVRFVNRNLYSVWEYSDEITYSVVDYDSPVAKLSNPTEIEEVKGYDVHVGATVDNANYFDGVTYQWYYVWAYAEGTPLYKAIENGTKNGYTFANADTATLTISRATTNADPLIVRCQVTGTKNGYKRNANTEDASVSFIDLPLPVINTQPQGANLAKANNTHAIAVYASTKQGTLTYQWQSSEDGNVWENIANADAFNYLVDRSVATNGTYYRCVVSNAAGSIGSDAAKFVIKDGTVLNAALMSGLSVSFAEGNSDYTLDNDDRTLVCHLGDVFLIGFEASEGNATDFDKSIGTDWRNETGLNDNGMGKKYIDTSMAGTFEYYGRFYAEYDDGLGHVQSIEYNRGNDERMRFTIVVLPREDEAEINPVTVELGDSETIDVASANYEYLFTNGDVSTTAQTWFRGNHKASSYYHFVTGYRLYVGIPNENGEIEYICFAQTDYYGDGIDPYNNAQDLIFDTSAAKLSALEIETLDGVYDAYVVMDYQSIVNENVDDQFVVKRGAFEGHHFALTVVAPCQHEHVTATYTFGTDETYGAYIMIANKCDICEENLAGAYIWVYRTGEADGLPLISQAATCTEDGMRAHKHFTLGGYDKYYVEDATNHWVECADPSTLVIKAGHNYQAVAATAATCTADGNHAHFECSVCHKEFVQDGEEYYEVEPESLVIDAFHKHLESVGEVPATCSAYGVQAYYTCSQCGKSFTDALGEHEIADLNAWKVGDGKIDKLAHDWQWIVDTAATKTATGIKHEECSVCHERRSENTVIPMQDCDHEHVTLTAQVDPTCTAAGKKAYYHCTDCNKYFEDANCQLLIENLDEYGILEALGHDWGDWHVVTPATETQDGVEERVCQNNPEHKEQRAITASGFSYTTDEQGIKVFEHSAALGTPSDFAALFAAAKAANGKVKISAGNLVLTFDANAVSAIGGNAANLTASVLTSNFGIDGLGGIQVVIELSLGNTTFANGTVSVKLPFTTAVPEGKVAKVYYVDAQGNKTDMNATFANGFVSFNTNHFSKFAVVFENAQQDDPVNPQPSEPEVNPSPEKKGLSGGAIAGIVIAIVVVLAGAGVGCFFLLKKKGVIKLGKKDTNDQGE